MKTFKVGDRIIMRENCDAAKRGMIGVVVVVDVEDDVEDYGVKFDATSGINGHDLGGRVTNGRGQWIWKAKYMNHYDTNKDRARQVLEAHRGTQISRVIQHMLVKDSISQLEAMNYGVRRLASRITDIKNEGVKINAERKKDLHNVPYVRYSIAAV